MQMTSLVMAQVLRPFVLRRLKEVVAAELPRKVGLYKTLLCTVSAKSKCMFAC